MSWRESPGSAICGDAVQNISQKSGIRHTVPGGVNHNAYPGDIHFFCMVHLGLSPILPQNPQCPEPKEPDGHCGHG